MKGRKTFTRGLLRNRRARRRKLIVRTMEYGDPTPAARQVWAALWPEEPWPAHWQVMWARFMRGCTGLCINGSRQILLSYADAAKPTGDAVATLVHEFIHVRCWKLRHGVEFSRLCQRAAARIGVEYRDTVIAREEQKVGLALYRELMEKGA